MNELYVTHSLRSFAMSTISVFMPIFLLKKEFSFLAVILYFAFNTFFGTIFMYAGLKLASKKGVKHVITVSMPILIAFFLLLYNFDYLLLHFNRYLVLFFVSGIIAFSGGLYFAGFHVDFAKCSSKEKVDSQVGIVNALSMVFSIIGPFFGALVISIFSFEVLFIIIILVLFVAIIPLFFSEEVSEPFEFKLKKSFSRKSIKKNYVFFAEGMRDYAARIFWPFLLFFLAINLKSIGGIFTLSNALLALFTFYVGKKMNDGNRHRIMNFGAWIHSLSLVVRTLLKTASTIAITQGFGAISFSMINIPFHSVLYSNSKKKGIAYTIFSREIFLHTGRLVMTLLAIALFFILKDPKTVLIISIIIGAIFTFFMIQIQEESE